MEQLSGIDTLFVAGERESMPMHIGALLVYRSSTRQYYQRVEKIFKQRLCQSPIFTRKLQEPVFKLDNPYWIEDPEFKIEHHLHRCALKRGDDAGALEDLVATLHARGLDMNKPLWEACVIDGLHHLPGYSKGDYGLYLKVHHAAIDGVSGAEIIGALNDIEPIKPPRAIRSTPKIAETVSRASMIGNMLRHSVSQPGHLFKAYREMRRVPKSDDFNETPMHWTKAPINQAVSSHRIIETVSFPFSDVRAVKKIFPATTINHVALAIVGGALRHYLKARNELPEHSLGAAIPMNMRKSGDEAGGNLIGAMFGSLCTDIASPKKRLKMVRDSATSARSKSEAISRDVVDELAAGMPRRATELGLGLLQRVTQRFGAMPLPVHTIVSNVPGPPCALYLGGDQMLDLKVYGLVLEPIGLFHTVTSYDGMLNLSVLACPNSLQDRALYRSCLQKAFAEYVALV